MSRAIERMWSEIGELQAEHRDAVALSEFAHYRGRPLEFFSEVLGVTLWAGQVEIVEAVRDHPLVVVRSANGIGKDFVAAILSIYWAVVEGGLALLTAPTQRQVVENTMVQVARVFNRTPKLPGELYRTALRVGKDGAGILAFTSSDASSLTGFHHPKVLGILSEAQGIPEWGWEAMIACAVGQNDRVLAIGNPLEPAGRFYRASHAGHWHAIRLSALDHPNVVEEREVIPGAITIEGVKRIENDFGRNSNSFVARVLGDFPTRGEQGLIDRTWIDAAVKRHAVEPRYDMHHNPEPEPVVACDPARYGNDATVVAVRMGDRITEIASWRGADTMETADKVAEIAGRYRMRPGADWGRIVVDTIGIGSGVYDRLLQLGFGGHGFNAGSGARHPVRFMNLRAEAYWGLRDRLEEGRCELPDDDELTDELCAVRWYWTPNQQIRLEDKQDLRERIGRSPDRADAVVMAFGAPDRRFRVSEFRLR